MHDELHPAGLVEESFEDDVVHRRNDSERVALSREIVPPLGGAGRIEGAFVADPALEANAPAVDFRSHYAPQPADLFRKKPRARRSFTEPERHVRRLSVGIDHANDAAPRLDPTDSPRVRTENEDVPRHTFDRPVFVDGAHQRLVRIEDDAIIRDVGDGAAVRERDEAGGAPSAEDSIDAIVVQERTAASPPGRRALRVARDDGVELGAIHLGIGRGLTSQREEVVFRPVLGRALGDDVLRQDIERRARRFHLIEASARDRADERGALDELVPRRREEAPPRRASERVTGTPDPLQKRGDRAR